MTKLIPGVIDAAGLALLAGHVTDDEYKERADAHRPDVDGLRAEAVRLLGTGLSVRDVAVALRLGEDVVKNWTVQP
jgi:hypothetical protein